MFSVLPQPSKFGNPHGVTFLFGQHFKDPNCVTDAEKADLSRQCKLNILKQSLVSPRRHGAKFDFALF